MGIKHDTWKLQTRDQHARLLLTGGVILSNAAVLSEPKVSSITWDLGSLELNE